LDENIIDEPGNVDCEGSSRGDVIDGELVSNLDLDFESNEDDEDNLEDLYRSSA
jgi:hypothetical protein